MKSAVRSVGQLLAELDLESEITDLPAEAAKFPVFVPRPFLARIEKGNITDPLLRQVLPIPDEGVSPGHFSTDPLAEQAATLHDGLIQKYQKRVLVIASAACAVNCRYCFRRHFPYESAAIGRPRWEEIANSIAADTSLNEVILSGGDPLTVSDERLSEILGMLAEIKHVQRVRIHSRLPIVIPQRVTDSLLDVLWQFRNSRVGRQVVMVVHTNHANEIDDDVADSLRRLSETATQTLNQSVLLAGVNDDAETLIGLSERLLLANVLPYYLHQLDPIIGTSHFEVPVLKGKQLIESIRARLPGFAVPRYVQELAGENSKTVIA